MTPEITVLSLTAAAIAFVHTLLGPDHYLPFLAMARARKWTLKGTVKITLLCGLGHVIGSVLLGMLGILLGSQLASLEWLEAVRGELAAWLLIGFGIAYTAWGLRQAWRNRPHRHYHRHDGVLHSHLHSHQLVHAHVHEQAGVRKGGSITPWVIFVIFVLGPCEPLIPLLMYPAARESTLGVMMVAGVFGLVTVATMTAVVAASMLGLDALKRPAGLRDFERYGHAVAGSAILVCGLSVAFLGV